MLSIHFVLHASSEIYLKFLYFQFLHYVLLIQYYIKKLPLVATRSILF